MNKLYWNFEVGSKHGTDWLKLDVELMKFEEPLFYLPAYSYPATNLLARFIEPYLKWTTNISYVSNLTVKEIWEKQCPLVSVDAGYIITEAVIVAPAKLFKELHDRLLEFDGYPRYSPCV